MKKKPNVMLILCDDMGFSDIGCYGGEVRTPNLDMLGEQGLKFTQFYTTPRCSPSRASILTGLYPHQTGVGVLTENQLPDGYEGNLNQECITIAEALKTSNYTNYMVGKWHVSNDWFEDKSNWPLQRGFDRFYGIIAGSANYYNPVTLTRDNENIEHEAASDPRYYFTDAISENAASFVHEHASKGDGSPFFMYVAYTAPHWPLHAWQDDIDQYRNRFSKGWDTLREERMQRLIDIGIIDSHWAISPREPSQPSWEDISDKEWEQRRMEVYAAQIDRMDQGIGSILDALKSEDMFDNTLILFLADNGGCAEDLKPNEPAILREQLGRKYTKDGKKVKIGNYRGVMPGGEDTYQSYAQTWANLSNTPFRYYKHWTHEGGISTPFIAHWPEGIEAKGELRKTPSQIIDIMPTIMQISGTSFPTEKNGKPTFSLEGVSLTSRFEKDSLKNRMIFWEHEGNCAVRDGKWKLVKKYAEPWELYDMEEDRTELHDLSSAHRERTDAMISAWKDWAERCKVIPWENILAYEQRKKDS